MKEPWWWTLTRRPDKISVCVFISRLSWRLSEKSGGLCCLNLIECWICYWYVFDLQNIYSEHIIMNRFYYFYRTILMRLLFED
jgi:hypothetical protein